LLRGNGGFSMKLWGIIAVVCCTLPLVGMQADASTESPALSMISYTDIINSTSPLWRSAKSYSFHNCVRLLQAGVTSVDVATVLITDVPGIDGRRITATLQMINKELSYDVRILDEDNQLICMGQWDANEARLCELYGTSKVRGTTTLYLWDALWMLCGIKKGTLEDASEYGGLRLRYVLPYVDGCSWFHKHGYYSTRFDAVTYAAAIVALTTRPCSAVKARCAPNIQSIIQDAMDLLHLGSTVTIGELIKKLYTYCRFDSTASDIHRGWLLKIYKAVLKNKSFDAITTQMYHLLKHPDLEKLNSTLSRQ